MSKSGLCSFIRVHHRTLQNLCYCRCLLDVWFVRHACCLHVYTLWIKVSWWAWAMTIYHPYEHVESDLVIYRQNELQSANFSECTSKSITVFRISDWWSIVWWCMPYSHVIDESRWSLLISICLMPGLLHVLSMKSYAYSLGSWQCSDLPQIWTMELWFNDLICLVQFDLCSRVWNGLGVLKWSCLVYQTWITVV